MLKERCDDLEYRIQSIILDDFMERAFKSDNQRFDLALRDGVRKLVSEELEKRRIDNGL